MCINKLMAAVIFISKLGLNIYHSCNNSTHGLCFKAAVFEPDPMNARFRYPKNVGPKDPNKGQKSCRCMH